MGHDIDIINIKSGEIICSTYITGKYTVYTGIHSIHGHKNNTVIKIIKGLIDNFNNEYKRDKDPRNDLEYLKGLLNIANEIENEKDANDIYWYSDKVEDISKEYDSDGIKRPSNRNMSESSFD